MALPPLLVHFSGVPRPGVAKLRSGHWPDKETAGAGGPHAPAV